MESTGIVIKETIRNCTNQEKKFCKLDFEEIIAKSTLYLLVNFLPHYVPPLLAPLTLPFKNFNRATFTTYYIKKTAANFTLNRVLLMLNAYFCFYKKFIFRFIAFLTIFSDIKKITGPQNFLDILSVRRLKKVENHLNRQHF